MHPGVGGRYSQGYGDTHIEPNTAEGKEVRVGVPKVCAPLCFKLLVFDLTTVRSQQSLNLLMGGTAAFATPSDPTGHTPVWPSAAHVSDRTGGPAVYT